MRAEELDLRGRLDRSGRWLYVLLLALGLFPVVLFVVLGFGADRFDLQGAGGPLLAYAAGVLSFVSPCVLPLVPIYLTQLAGTTVEEGRILASRATVLKHAVTFLLGLSLVFIALGASAGALGFFLQDHQRELEQGAGILLIVLGSALVPGYGKGSPLRSAAMLAAASVLLVAVVELADLRGDRVRVALLVGALLLAWLKFSGFIELSIFSRTFQVEAGRTAPVGLVRSFVTGAAFAAGWTPCVGPVLGGILTLASQSGEVLTGVYLLAFYAAGFSIPFLITAVAATDATRAMRALQRWGPAAEVVAALMLVALGVLLLSGRLTALNQYFGFAQSDTIL